jgi:hypothetical protein
MPLQQDQPQAHASIMRSKSRPFIVYYANVYKNNVLHNGLGLYKANILAH